MSIRRLTVILAADVVGFSAMMELDEEASATGRCRTGQSSSGLMKCISSVIYGVWPGKVGWDSNL